MAGLNKFHWLSLILGLTITMPIWWYLLYKILQAINATELMWFLYFVYIPVAIVIAIISKIAEGKENS